MRFIKQWGVVVVLIVSVLGMYSVGESANILCGHGTGPCAGSPIEGTQLFNTQTTGGAAAAVVITLTAVTGSRTHIYSIEARCNTAAATSDVTITDGGVTIWTTPPLGVVNAATNFVRNWSTGLTGASNSAVVITLAACAGGGTGTLIVQADKW